MNRDFYSFSLAQPNEKDYYYFFTSIGSKGSILKLTAFQHIKDNLYNMALLDYDMEQDEGSDSVVSNNRDMPKVFATVAHILFDFLDKLPNISVLVEANSEIKRKLYNRIIKNQLKDLPKQYEILGILDNNETEIFAEGDYQAVIIQKINL
jgi:hypothetical protein